jgi:hypothetical protein
MGTMSLRIYKYPLDLTERQSIRMPSGATILSLQVQHGQICLWAVVDPDAPLMDCVFLIVGTGHPLPDEVERVYAESFTRHPQGGGGQYIGTVQMAGGSFVWHVFTGATPQPESGE